ncbi:MAG: alpha/beta fold hydrolase [Actinobacteria bacterium]|nr:alpha/beta fold hydrolase [Actinomycetota bacterium]
MSVLIKPWPRDEVFFPARTLTFRHAQSANPDAEPALMLHGLGGSSLNWTDLMGNLLPHLSMWALDLPGFGMSPPPRDGNYTPLGHARAAVDFIEQQLEGKPVHLFGNSMGGAVALQVAARRPDLVRTLTLISPALPDISPNKANITLPIMAIPGVGEAIVKKYNMLAPAIRVRSTIQTCFANPTRVAEQRFEESVAEAELRKDFTYANDAFLQSLRGLLGSYFDSGRHRPWKLAELVQVQTLIIYGLKDPLVDPRTAHKSTKHFKNAQVMVLPDSAHVSQMEHPDVVADAWMKRFR